VIHSREQLMKQFKELVDRDDITGKMMDSLESSFEELFNVEILKYDDLLTKVRNTFEEQNTLLAQIVSENSQFVQQSQVNAQMQQRQQILQQFDNAYKAYTQLREHLNEGIQFYSNFQDLLNKFNTKCSDFVLTRNIEKEELIASIQNPESTNKLEDSTMRTDPTSPTLGHHPPPYMPQPGMYVVQQPGAMPNMPGMFAPYSPMGYPYQQVPPPYVAQLPQTPPYPFGSKGQYPGNQYPGNQGYPFQNH